MEQGGSVPGLNKVVKQIEIPAQVVHARYIGSKRVLAECLPA